MDSGDRHGADQVANTTSHHFAALPSVETGFVHVPDNFGDCLADLTAFGHVGVQVVLCGKFAVDFGEFATVVTLHQELELLNRERFVGFVKCVTFVDG